MKPFLNWITVVWVLLCLCPPALADCEHPLGRLVSLQGTAQMRVSGQTAWAAANMDQTFCPGDLLQIEPNSRAAVVLNNHTILRLDQNTTIHFVEPSGKSFSLIHLVRGFLHIFSHKPRSLHIATPYINGAVEGTEFLVQVDAHQARFTVFEGAVLASNEQGELRLTRGQSAVAGQGQAPQLQILVSPRDAAQWTLYFPHIFDSSSGIADRSAWARMSYAAEKLALGQVAEASAVLNELHRLDPANSDVLALLAIQSLVLNNKGEAMALVDQAIQANPDSATAALARSYVQQADFKLDDARATLAQAASSHPNNAEIHARLAEMQLAGGDAQAAYATALAAAQRNPDNSRSQMVLGFVHLARIDTNEALHTFKEAIRLDPVQAMAHLGVGLALIRKGQIEEGRAAMELAAALDPGNALIRSYLGKAYFEENRGALAQREYAIAKELDPADPTPWFYDALRKQSENRPGEALQDLQKSIELNDNRAVYRSRLLLDEDSAVRTANLSSIYTDLGFENIAKLESAAAINAEPADYTAHRLLSDMYFNLNRHEIASASELLMSQLLQPVNASAQFPRMPLGDKNTGMFRGTSFFQPGFNDYSSLFSRNQIAVTSSSVVGSQGILGEELALSGLQDKISASISGLHYTTDGFRENNDLEQKTGSVYAKAAINPQASIMAEYRLFERDFGDLTLRFAPDDYYANDRFDDRSESIRLGAHYKFSDHSDLIGTIVTGDYDFNYHNEPTNGSDLFSDRLTMFEIQHLLRFNKRNNLLYGLSYYDSKGSENYIFPEYNINEILYSRNHDTKFYSYTNHTFNNDLKGTLGFNTEFIDVGGWTKKEAFNPKFGLAYKVFPSTTLRTHAARTIQGLLVNDQTIEPTQLAGFNQFHDDFLGEEVWQYGVGIDQKMNATAYVGLEFFWRDRSITFQDSYGIWDESNWDENQITSYWYWLPFDWLSTTIGFIWENHQRELNYTSFEMIHNLQTKKLPMTASIHLTNMATMVLRVTYIDQQGDFQKDFTMPYTVENKSEFIIADIAFSYNLPNRLGILSVEGKNLFNKKFKYQSVDEPFPEYTPEQCILCKFMLSF